MTKQQDGYWYCKFTSNIDAWVGPFDSKVAAEMQLAKLQAMLVNIKAELHGDRSIKLRKQCQCPIEHWQDVNPGHMCAVCGGVQ